MERQRNGADEKIREMIAKAESQVVEVHELCSNAERETLMRMLYKQVSESRFAPLERCVNRKKGD